MLWRYFVLLIIKPLKNSIILFLILCQFSLFRFMYEDQKLFNEKIINNIHIWVIFSNIQSHYSRTIFPNLRIIVTKLLLTSTILWNTSFKYIGTWIFYLQIIRFESQFFFLKYNVFLNVFSITMFKKYRIPNNCAFINGY